MKIIPAIDIREGKCVRLAAGDFSRAKTYGDDPLSMALSFQDEGATALHLVDLDGARLGKAVNYGILERIAAHTSLAVDFGGGLGCERDLFRAFECGAAQVNIGSAAVRDRASVLEWMRLFGGERIILAADVRRGKIVSDGGTEESGLDAIGFIRDFRKEGMNVFSCTDVERDGMLGGPSFALYEQVLQAVPDLKLIGGGGITTVDDLLRLREIGVKGAVIGKALYEGKLTLRAVREGLGGLG